MTRGGHVFFTSRKTTERDRLRGRYARRGPLSRGHAGRPLRGYNAGPGMGGRPVPPQPFRGEIDSDREWDQAAFGFPHITSDNASGLVECGAQSGEIPVIEYDILVRPPAPLALFGDDATIDPPGRARHVPVLGQVETCARFVADAHEQHPGARLVEPSERGRFAEMAVGPMT